MNKEQENKLISTARDAEALRKIIDQTKSLLRSWSTRKKQLTGNISLSLSAHDNSYWRIGIDLSIDHVSKALIPIIRRIHKEAVDKLNALELPK